MTPELQVSVIIPVYNEERYVAQAIQSVLDQDYDDVEVVVVDDGSTDRSAEIVRQFEGVCLVSQQNAGHGASLNTGFANARGELVAFLDADDLWEPATLRRRVARFANDSGLEMTHDTVLEFISPELESQLGVRDRVTDRPVRARLCGATIVRRAAIERVGLIDTKLKLGSWMDWLMRAQDTGLKTEFHDELVLHRRIHDDNLTLRERESKGDYVRLLKRALDRRRGAVEPHPVHPSG